MRSYFEHVAISSPTGICGNNESPKKDSLATSSKQVCAIETLFVLYQ